MKMTLFVNIGKRSNDKFRRNDSNRFYRRDIVARQGQFILVLFQLYEFDLITAATTGFEFMCIHPAHTTFVSSRFKKMNRCQLLHAIMKIDDHAAGDSEIAEE